MIGMVDQRFDHIDSGALSPAGPRTYFWPSALMTWTSPPHTPVSAQSRTADEEACAWGSPFTSGAIERPWVRCGEVTPKTSAIVACRSTLVVNASQAPAGCPGHA